MGGRLDAVNVIDTDCAVITGIDLDHTEYLGPDRESIGLEKAHVMRPGKPAILADPSPPASVLRHAESIGADLWLLGRDFGYTAERLQWAWRGRGRHWPALAHPALRGANQLQNAAGAIAALESLRAELPVAAQALREGLAKVELQGRFQIVPGAPALVLDVAHNPQAVTALATNLEAMGFFPSTHAVFGAMRDKDLAGVLGRMLPIVDHWHLCDLPTPRAASAAELGQLVETLSGGGRRAGISLHAGPSEALRAAVDAVEATDRIVVFGSFYTVGGVLQNGLPRLAAKP